MKKLLLLFLTIVISASYSLANGVQTNERRSTNIIVSVWDGISSNTSWYDESQSEYHLKSAADLKGFADLVDFNKCNFEGKTVYLETDVDLDNHPWYPIGLHNSSRFDGNFNGNYHSITNLLIDRLDYPDMKDNLGFFGYAINANISNLKLQGSINVTSSIYIGGVASRANKIENVYCDLIFTINNSFTNGNLGGVVGWAKEIKRAYCKGEIRFSDYYYIYSQFYLGGIAGGCGEISESCSNVDIYVRRYGQSDSQTKIGGITGRATSMKDVIFTGSISVTNERCTSDAFIAFTGGITGEAGSGDKVISAPRYIVYGRGWAKGKSAITSGYNNGATFSNTYYLSTWASGDENFGTPIDDAKLKNGVPLEGFDTDIWSFEEGNYPYLKSLKELEPAKIYTVTYYVDGVLYQVDQYYEGQTVTPAEEPTKEGYTFSGWGYVPPFIYQNSWVVYGSFIPNKYTISYVVDDEVYTTATIEFDSYITPPTMPYRSGCHFYWGEHPYKMPAYDITINGYYIEDSKEYVDLGLPSGLLWATHNIGAGEEQDSGEYFSWGEIMPKVSYYWGTYKYSNGAENSLTKYNYSDMYGQVDGKYVLEAMDDAATANWGEPWRLPTLEETQELISYCTWERVPYYTYQTAGYKVIGPNGNSIFFPASGVKQYMQCFYNYDQTLILTSTIFNDSSNKPNYACILFYDSDGPHWWMGWSRSLGFSARPVTGKNPSGVKTIDVQETLNVIGIYDMQGHKLTNLQKGINIVCFSDGSTRKIRK